MNENLKTNEKALRLIKESEGFRSNAYLCPAGVWTIGYGHTSNVKQGDVITEEAAEKLLIVELESFENGLKKLLKVQLNGNQFSALVSFVYNVGLTNFKNSTMLKLINKKMHHTAAEQFARWNKANGQVLPGLTKRRENERKLFLS